LSVLTESNLVLKLDAEAARRTKRLGHLVRRSDVVVSMLKAGLAGR
jgi:hypothetical protein